MHIVGVTGTNGKSSTIFYCKKILDSLNIKTWSVTNAGVVEPDGTKYPYFQLREKGGIKKLIERLGVGQNDVLLIEAYSSSLLAKEWEGVFLDVAAFTSFGEDHLDLHKDLNSYFKTKFSLFSDYLKNNGSMVISDNLPKKELFIELAKKKNLNLKIYKTDNNCFSSRILFRENFKCAINIVQQLQIKNFTKEISNYFFPLLKGRMEKVDNNIGIEIFIDFAHNPSGLEYVLKRIPSEFNRIILVFGAGGERDKTKRKEMGEIAEKYSDVIIVTDDNPRKENAKLIRRDLVKYCRSAIEISNRSDGIRKALDLSVPGDCIIICGMGTHRWFDKVSQSFVQDKDIILQNLN